MGGNGVSPRSTRSRRSGAVPLSAPSRGIPEQGSGPVWVTGAAGMSGPSPPRARGVPRQLLPLTLGARKAARAPAQLLFPVPWLCGRGPRSAAGSGRGGLRTPSAAVGAARGRSRPPLPRPARLEQLFPTFPSGPRPPRVAAAPVPAHPRAGVSGGSPAAAVAPRCFPRSVLVFISPSPCPPCTSTEAQLRPRAGSAWVPAGG